jgi:hypothetical protein
MAASWGVSAQHARARSRSVRGHNWGRRRRGSGCTVDLVRRHISAWLTCASVPWSSAMRRHRALSEHYDRGSSPPSDAQRAVTGYAVRRLLTARYDGCRVQTVSCVPSTATPVRAPVLMDSSGQVAKVCGGASGGEDRGATLQRRQPWMR